MRPKSIILLVLALGCGLVASIGINRVMANRPASEAVEADMVTLFVAGRDVNQNDFVPKDAIKEEQWPTAKIPPGAVLVKEDIEGRRCRSKLYAGEPFLEAKLLPKGVNGQSAVDNIPLGFRVVAVRVDDVTTLGNVLLPGDRVDIMVHLPPLPLKGIHEPMTKTFLQDVKIFALNDITERAPGGGEAKITARTVSFLVNPAQAEMITQASELGRIRLVLRNSSDGEVTTTPGSDSSGLFGAGGGQGNRIAEAEAVQPPKPAVIEPIFQPTVVADDVPPRNEFKMTIMRGAEIQEYVLDEGTLVARPVGGSKEPSSNHDAEPPAAPTESSDSQDEGTTSEVDQA